MARNTALPLAFFCLSITSVWGQPKHDYNWIMGYDYYQLPDEIICMNFNFCPVFISHINTVSEFWMEGSNTSMSDREGNLLFYTNGCYIVNKKGEIMENGDSINPGLIHRYWCPSGGCPLPQAVTAIPAPGSDSLYYVFNLDLGMPFFMTQYFGVAPEHLYYHVVDMSANDGLGKVIAKNHVAVKDTFSRGNVKAVRHANGVDWWVITPKCHTNCYFLTLVTAEGVQPPLVRCVGKVWSDLDGGAQVVFTPDAKKYIRVNGENGLNIFDFNNATGELSNPVVIYFPNDTFSHAGASVSANSRFLYISARKKLYQFDLQAADIAASKTLIGEWDGFSNPYPTIFFYSALAPDNKIYISGKNSHRYLHVIHEPDKPGLACRLEQRGVLLPSYNYATIPNFPHYRMSNEECDWTSNTIETTLSGRALALYPNPTPGELWVNFPDMGERGAELLLFDALGRLVYRQWMAEPLSRIDLSALRAGTYVYVVRQSDGVTSGRIAKVE